MSAKLLKVKSKRILSTLERWLDRVKITRRAHMIWRLWSGPICKARTSQSKTIGLELVWEHLDKSSKNATPGNENHQIKVCHRSRKRSARKDSLVQRRKWQRRSKKIYLGMVKPLHLIAASRDIFGILEAVLAFPMNFMMTLARGFHNAPLIYGDGTVRQPSHVTELQSGLRAAAKEFGYEMFDGISGLLTQPVSDVRHEGAEGLLKGIGKGFRGLILKPISAMLGLPTCTIYGVCKKATNIRGRHFDCSIIAARTVQGYEQWQASTLEERMEILRRWNAFR